MTKPRFTLVPALLLAILATTAFAAPPDPPERHASLPSVSPDGKRIVYLRTTKSAGSELRVVGTDGAGDKRVIPLDSGAALPGWGTGGKRVTITNVGRDYTSIFSVNMDGHEAKTLVKLPAKGIAASHDGKRLAFAIGSWRTSCLMVSDGKGKNARALTDSSAAWFNFAWSPDDRMLAVSRMDSSGAMQVWLVDPKDGKARALTDFPTTDGRPQWPAWSPDGKRIAVQAGKYERADPGNSESDIWVIDVASGKATRITERPRPWLDETPAWASNKQIVIQSSRTGRFELWKLNDDGTQPVQLTR